MFIVIFNPKYLRIKNEEFKARKDYYLGKARTFFNESSIMSYILE